MPKPKSACIFCNIARDEIPSEKVYEDDQLFVIRDLKPQAAVHLLVIPRQHINSVMSTRDADAPLLGALLNQARNVAVSLNLREGYRIIINNGSDARQEIDHLHVHVLGGEYLPVMMSTA